MASKSSHISQVEEKILEEQVRFLRQNTRPALFGALLMVIILSAFFFNLVQTVYVAGWAAINCTFLVVRFLWIQQFPPSFESIYQVKKWKFVLICGIFCSGLAFGMSGFWFFIEDSIIFQTLLMVILAGAALVSVGVTPYLPELFFPIAFRFFCLS